VRFLLALIDPKERPRVEELVWGARTTDAEAMGDRKAGDAPAT
jgi:hypothetical protein